MSADTAVVTSRAPGSEPVERRGWPAWRLCLVLLVVAALSRLPFVFIQGYWFDVLIFRRWASIAYEQGLPKLFSDPELDYVAYTQLLWVIAAIVDPFVSGPLEGSKALLQAVKLPGLIGDLAMVPLLFAVTRRWLESNPGLLPDGLGRALLRVPLPGGRDVDAPARAGLLAAFVYLANPGVIYTSGYWGQNDSLIAFFMLAAVFALMQERLFAPWVLVGLGFLVKPQPIVLGPLLVLGAWRKRGPLAVVLGGVAALATVVAGLSYLLALGLFDRLRYIYGVIFFDEGGRVSVGAWNLWSPAQVFEHAYPAEALFHVAGYAVTYADVSQALLLLVLGVVFSYFRRSLDPLTLLVAASYLVFAFFMLPMKIHERYLFPLFALLLPAALVSRTWLFFYAALTVTYFMNLTALFPIDKSAQRFIDDDWQLAFASLNMLLFVLFTALLLRPEVEAQVERVSAWLRGRAPPPKPRAAEAPAAVVDQSE